MAEECNSVSNMFRTLTFIRSNYIDYVMSLKYVCLDEFKVLSFWYVLVSFFKRPTAPQFK